MMLRYALAAVFALLMALAQADDYDALRAVANSVMTMLTENNGALLADVPPGQAQAKNKAAPSAPTPLLNLADPESIPALAAIVLAQVMKNDEKNVIRSGDQVMLSTLMPNKHVQWWQCESCGECSMFDCPGNTHGEDDHKNCPNNTMWIINVNKGGRYPIRHGDRVALRTYSGSWFGCYNGTTGNYQKDQCYVHSTCPGNTWDKWSESKKKSCQSETMVVIAPGRENKGCSTVKAARDADCVGSPIQRGDNVYFQLESDRKYYVSGKKKSEALKMIPQKNDVDFSEKAKPSQSFYLWSVDTNQETRILPGQSPANKTCFKDCLTRKGTNEMNCVIKTGDEVMFSNIDKSGSVSWWQCDGRGQNRCRTHTCPGATHNVTDHDKCGKNRFWIQNLGQDPKIPIRHGDYIGLRFTPIESKVHRWVGCYGNARNKEKDVCYADGVCPRKDFDARAIKHCGGEVMRVIAPARATKTCTPGDAATWKTCQGNPIYAGDQVYLKMRNKQGNFWVSADSPQNKLVRTGCPGNWHSKVETDCKAEVFNIWSKAIHLGIY